MLQTSDLDVRDRTACGAKWSLCTGRNVVVVPSSSGEVSPESIRFVFHRTWQAMM